MYIFYEPVSDTVGKVRAVYNDANLSAELQAQGIHVDAVPEPAPPKGMIPVMYINLTDNTVYYDYEEHAHESVDDLKRRLADAESKLKSADDRYKELDLNTASLVDVQAAKIAQLKELCDQAIQTSFVSTSLGYTFGFSKDDQDNLSKQALIFLGDATKTSCEWKTLDAGIITLTKDQFMNLLPEGEAHTRENVNKLWELIPQVQAATTNQEVDAIVWS